MNKSSIIFRIPRKLLRFSLVLLNKTILQPLEPYLVPGFNKPLAYPPIFIIGAPRSGSTLIAQVLIESFDVGYISNLHCLFFGAPSVLKNLFHLNKENSPPDFKSEHGVTKGWLSPSECGEYWYRFFRRRPAYLPLDEVNPTKMRNFRCSVNGLIKAFNKPILFKNMYAALRLRPIMHYIPESLFIVINRDIVENAHSLLEARKRFYGDYNSWWSMEPPAIDSLNKLPPEKQVVEQIRHIHALIQKDKEESGINANRFLYINYEDFCADVHANLIKVKDFLRLHGIEMQPNLKLIPKAFPVRHEVRISSELFQQVKNYVEYS